ncbi:MAG: bifunctional 5,6,7,8-tetrahydromethanopterin hydro-lyase/3-hexulose-6-phosphate synthase [Candidatus Jordarchaeum sp.]|uniref:bifunctional 5,6,7,8-tetrahydromethanopterin hydro-lyase/3-hexulose-6-phosphate synthase n=1 Tax=Candidatus Jordarchaeum sp. TaxID=2823881 RepID=UPI0040498C25
MTYLIGEALVGKGQELAHVDLLVGEKEGPVGTAFAQGLATLSSGHTPLLGVIRPNLPPKPHVLIVPKVTVKNMEEANKIFGPAQAAVAKAIADAVEEGLVPKDKLDTWVIIASIFIHPEAKDYRKIYHYNYSATKLALSRALTNYPPLEKILYDKDRATHPVAGLKVPRLWRPPYLQIALDNPSMEQATRVIKELPKSDRIILEAGTPLIKRYGVSAVSKLREVAPDIFIIADLKTLDTAQVEVDIAYEETADAVVVSGLASNESIDRFIYEARRLGIYSIIDMMEVPDPVEKLGELKSLPDVVILHRAIDVEATGEKPRWHLIKEIKNKIPKDSKMLFAVAGGITPETAGEALAAGADILIVGRYITQSKDIERATREFIEVFVKELPKEPGDVDLFRYHVE